MPITSATASPLHTGLHFSKRNRRILAKLGGNRGLGSDSMGKPRMILLIRHAQSEGNKNRDIHQMIPDHRVKLTQEGRQQVRTMTEYE